MELPEGIEPPLPDYETGVISTIRWKHLCVKVRLQEFHEPLHILLDGCFAFVKQVSHILITAVNLSLQLEVGVYPTEFIT